MSTELMLDVDQAGELKAAFRRTRGSNGALWTNEAIKRCSEGDFLGEVLDALEGRAKIVPVKPEATAPAEKPAPAALIPFRDNLPLGATKTVAMTKLFRNGRGVTYYYRDDCLDSWFTPNCQEGKAGTFRVVATPKAMKFREMAQSATGNHTDSIADLSRAVVAAGLDITPAQFDEQIVATQNGADILLVNGRANFAFAKTGKTLKDASGEYEEVVVLYADRRDDGRWRAFVFRLGGSVEWFAGRRLLLRNKV